MVRTEGGTQKLAPLVTACALGAIASSAAEAGCEPEQVSRITAVRGEAEDLFGTSVAIDGDVAVVGTALSDERGEDSGCADVFRREGEAWVQTARLTASDGAPGDQFGVSLAIDGSAAVVGAHLDSDDGQSSGSAYVFRFDGASWVQEQKLTASDAAANDRFGIAVTMRGDAIVVGAWGDDATAGSAYVFRFDGASWAQEQKLTASDRSAGDAFGIAVALDADVAIVGAFQDDETGGSAYVFRGDGASWSEEQKLTAGDGAAGQRFGVAVSISGDIAIIGSSFDDENGVQSGAAYVFEHDGGTWTEAQKIGASDGEAFDVFGASVAVDTSVAVIGAPGDDDRGNGAGSAYVFRDDGGTWVEETPKMRAEDGAAFDSFGQAVAISSGAAVVGAPWADDDEHGENAGAAYVFDLNCPRDCPADVDVDGLVGFEDLVAVLAAWGNEGGPEDVDGSGVVDFEDVIALLAAWGACA